MSLDDMVVQRTSALISSLIQKPTMRSNLLLKPPFRFLHDIFVAVVKSTGLGEGLFDANSLDSANIKDKEAKINFLRRWIDFVSNSIGEQLQANPQKIVAGLDVENTNLLLQAFASLAIRVRDGQATNADLLKSFQNSSIKDESAAVSVRPADAAIDTDPIPKSQTSPISNPVNSVPPSIAPATMFAATPEILSNIEVSQPKEESLGEDIASQSGKITNNFFPNSANAVATSKPTENNTSEDLKTIVSHTNSTQPTSFTSPLENTQNEKSFVEITQQKLSAIITRPTLKKELLQRPPFRFVQDIVKEIHATTGCFGNTFQQEELTSKIDGAPAKSLFLEKLISFVSAKSGACLKVNVKKILAGQDSEKTNELLQLLADVVKSQHSNALSHSIPFSQDSVIPTKPAQTKRQSEANEIPKSATFADENTENSTAKQSEKDSRNFNVPHTTISYSSPSDAYKARDTASQVVLIASTPPLQASEETSIAGPAPPKVQQSVKSDSQAEQNDSGSFPSGIILEGEDIKDDGQEEDEDVDTRRSLVSKNTDVQDEKAHGRLVRDILKQQEKSSSAKVANEGQAPSAVEKSTGIKLGRIGGKERRSSYSQQTVDLLRENIQKVCQSVNPLGKCIDFVNEDLELMWLELEKWRQEQVVQKTRLEKEKKATDEFLQPLQKDLDKIETQISDTRSRIQKLRANIIGNDDQLKQLLERQIKT